MQIVVTFDPACGVDERKAVLWCAALDAQAQEFSAAWGVPYWPVSLYSSDVLKKMTPKEMAAFVADSHLCTVQMTMVAGALGFHDDVAGVIFARVLWQGDATSVTLSHEILEMMGDPKCNAWRRMPDRRDTALEACDAVEGDVYIETADVGGDLMPVDVSNYLLPSWFKVGGAGPYDRMSKLTAPFDMTPGGYMIVRDRQGNETQVFAASDAGRINLARKLEKPRGRLARRLRG